MTSLGNIECIAVTVLIETEGSKTGRIHFCRCLWKIIHYDN